MASEKRHRFLFEYKEINEASLQRVEELIYCDCNAGCWLLHNKRTWQGIVLVLVDPKKPIDRKHFSDKRNNIHKKLASEGLSNYHQVSEKLIDKTLENFIKQPDFSALNSATEQYEELIEKNKAPNILA